MDMDKKKRAGEKAVEFVQPGMIVGLGTGSTAYWAVRKLGELVKGGLHIRGIATSAQTEDLALQLGIPLISLGECEYVDLTIDGADEIDSHLDMIKGGGGALFREKMVALASKRVIIVADDTKLVRQLGSFRLPVEIVPFGWETTARQVERLGCLAVRREEGKTPFVTDNGNWIVDCDFGAIPDPASLHRSLKTITGVVETGLFVDTADWVVVATDTEVQILPK
jgi:ribose 5-phosphate isomerase A